MGGQIIFLLLGLLLLFAFSFPFLYFFGIWIRAKASRADVSIVNLIGMKLRKVPPALIVEAQTTTVVSESFSVSLNSGGALILERKP